MISVEKCNSKEEWDDAVLEKAGHPLQLWGWGELKAAHNWRVVRVMCKREGDTVGAAQLLVRNLPQPFGALVYVPRGPVAAEQDRGAVLEALVNFVKQEFHPIALTIEPNWTEVPEVAGWRKSTNTILIPRTLILDLHKTEAELLADMAKKTRQYIRKSTNESLEVRQVKSREELAACLAIYHDTAVRAGFTIHDDTYYYDVFTMLGDHSPVFAAFVGDKPVAFLWLAISSETAFELYGGMNDMGQQLRANYALKWQTIQAMKRWGIHMYDMNGLLNDGVSTFKQGFATHENMLAGTYDYPMSPLYTAWTKGLPLAKKIVRSLKRR